MPDRDEAPEGFLGIKRDTGILLQKKKKKFFYGHGDAVGDIKLNLLVLGVKDNK